MVMYMDAILRMNTELNTEERVLLSSAYKNAFLPRRQAWDKIKAAAQSAERNRSPEFPLFLKYREILEEEMRQTARKLLTLLESYLQKNNQEPEAKAFFYNL